MFVFVLFVALISTILLVQSEETTATTSTSNENIVPVSAELWLKTEIMQERRLGEKPDLKLSTKEEAKKMVQEKSCLCYGSASFNHCWSGKESRFTICCVPKVPCMCCEKVDTSYIAYKLALDNNKSHTDVNAVNVNNALFYMLPKTFKFIEPNTKPKAAKAAPEE